jgi:hypothetical protein
MYIVYSLMPQHPYNINMLDETQNNKQISFTENTIKDLRSLPDIKTEKNSLVSLEEKVTILETKMENLEYQMTRLAKMTTKVYNALNGKDEV